MSALSSALKLTCRYHRWLRLICLVFLITASICDSQRTRRERPAGDNDVAQVSLSYTDKDVDIHDDDEISLNGDFERNITAEKGRYLGSPCDFVCNPELQHVFCDAITGLCECEKFYPVRLGPTKGCAKPKRLGEQCFYRATCTFADQHSTCTQIQHNAVCDCEEGYHRVSLSRPNKKVFCAENLVLITTDLPTLLFIASGIAIFTGMICFVLKLFSRARYSRPRHYANANHSSMLFSSDTGIPLTLHGRPSSRSSQQSGSAGPLGCAFTRRPSSGGSRGPLVPASRAGSRRPSLASVHSTGSSSRSYSARRLEKERNEKEQRQALQELRLAKQREQTPQQQQQQQQVVPTPSPRTPHSTDELLPSVEEGKEVFYNEQVPTISGVSDATPMAVTTTATVTTAITTSTAITTRISEISPKATPIKAVFDTSAAPRTSDDIFQA